MSATTQIVFPSLNFKCCLKGFQHFSSIFHLPLIDILTSSVPMTTGQPLQTHSASHLLTFSQMKGHKDARSNTEIPGGAIGKVYYHFPHSFITHFSLFLKHTHTHMDTHTPTYTYLKASSVPLSWTPKLLPIPLDLITSLLCLILLLFLLLKHILIIFLYWKQNNAKLT